GDHTALWAGTGALMISVGVAARPELVGALLGRVPDPRTLAAVSDSAMAVAPLLFAAGLLPWFQRRSFGPTPLVLAAISAVAALALVLRAAPSLGPAFLISQVTGGHGAGSVVGGL